MEYKDFEKLEDKKLKKLIDEALIIYKDILGTELNFKNYHSLSSTDEKILISIILSLYINDFDNEFSKNDINIENVFCGLETNSVEKIASILINSSEIISESERESLLLRFDSIFFVSGLSENNINFEKLIGSFLDDRYFCTFIELVCSEKVLKILGKYSLNEGKNLDDTKKGKIKNDKKREHINMFGLQSGFLDKNGINLNEKEYKYNPAIGREDIIRKCAITLETPTKSVLIVGPNGVGKTAIVEGLAKSIIDGKFLENYEIIEISASSLISGKGIVGSFEEGIDNLLSEIEERGNVILFIDEIHQIYEMGIRESNAMNMFKKPLSEGKLKLIGATTKNEYDNTLKYDSAFVDRFDVYEVFEPKENIIKDIIIQRINFLEDFYNICFPFDDRDTSKFADYLIKITDKENRRLNQMTYNPRLVVQLLDTIFATSKINNHKVVEKEDIIEAISSNTKIKPQRYSMPRFCYGAEKNIEEPKILNNVIDFNSYINKK